MRRGLGAPDSGGARASHPPAPWATGPQAGGAGSGSVPAPPDLDGRPGSKARAVAGPAGHGRSAVRAREAALPDPAEAAPSGTGTYRGFGASDVIRWPRCPPRRGPGEAAPGRPVSGVRGVSAGQVPGLPDSRLHPRVPLRPRTWTCGDSAARHRPLWVGAGRALKGPRATPTVSPPEEAVKLSAPWPQSVEPSLSSFLPPPNSGGTDTRSRYPTRPHAWVLRCFWKEAHPRSPPPAGAET